MNANLGSTVLCVGGLAQPGSPGELLLYETVRSGHRIHCTNNACESLETAVRTSFSPAEQPQLLGTESVREQSKDLGRKHALALTLIDELQDGAEPSALVPLTVELLEEPFDYSVLRGTRGQERAALIAARKAQLEPIQHDFLSQIEQLGGQPLGVSKLTNQVDLTFPAGRLGELLLLDGVVGISRADGVAGNSQANGWTIRNTAFGQTVLDQHGGQGSNHDGGEVRVAVIEYGNSLNIQHFAWRDWSGGPSRVLLTRECMYHYYAPFGGYECWTSASGSASTHGTTVTSVLMGSIEQAQDPNFPGNGTVDQIRRSGIARESETLYYRADNSWALRAAIEHAMISGADVINMSMHVGDETCSGAADHGGVRGQVMAAENAGVVLVAASGNLRNGVSCADGSNCDINFPAALTDVMAIGGTDLFGSYADNGIWAGSMCGRASTPIASGISRWAPMIDLVTHCFVEEYAAGGTQSYGPSTFGTSFATPIVAGAAALTRDWMSDLGWPEADEAYGVRANLLVMGDASWQIMDGDPVSRIYNNINWGFGFGRLKYRWPNPASSAQLGADGSWGSHSFLLSPGQTVAFTLGDGNPLPASILGWKLAVIADENTYGEMPDLNVRIVDTCVASNPIVQSAARLAGRWRVVLDQNVHSLPGKCLEARITADATSGPVEVFAADYGFSNSYSKHLILDY